MKEKEKKKPMLVYNFIDKDSVIQDYIDYQFSKSSRMFKYANLPKTIEVRDLEYLLQNEGKCAFIKVKDDYYVTSTNLCPPLSPYGRGTIARVTNPYLIYKDYKIDKECVVIYNDSAFKGLRKANLRYATSLTENDITFNMLDIVKRAPYIISASDTPTIESAKQFIKKLIGGDLDVIGDNYLLESLKTLDSSSRNSTLTELIEAQQYIKASWDNFIGLNSNYNMKREAIVSSEIELNNDSLLPMVDDMLECRKEALEKINVMFGLNISVELNGAWKQKSEENCIKNEEVGDNDNEDNR